MIDIIKRTLVATFMYATLIVIIYSVIVMVFGQP